MVLLEYVFTSGDGRMVFICSSIVMERPLGYRWARRKKGLWAWAGVSSPITTQRPRGGWSLGTLGEPSGSDHGFICIIFLSSFLDFELFDPCVISGPPLPSMVPVSPWAERLIIHWMSA